MPTANAQNGDRGCPKVASNAECRSPDDATPRARASSAGGSRLTATRWRATTALVRRREDLRRVRNSYVASRTRDTKRPEKSRSACGERPEDIPLRPDVEQAARRRVLESPCQTEFQDGGKHVFAQLGGDVTAHGCLSRSGTRWRDSPDPGPFPLFLNVHPLGIE